MRSLERLIRRKAKENEKRVIAMNTVIDVASAILFFTLLMYAAIKLDEAARKLHDAEERIYGSRRKK